MAKFAGAVCGWSPLLWGELPAHNDRFFFSVGDLYNDDDSDNRRSDATWNWKRIDCILICFTSDQSWRARRIASRRSVRGKIG